MKTKTIKKNHKPTEIDAHIKYVCPSQGCLFEHWLSLNEAQTRNFKVVCECGCVFKPKQIKKLKIVYRDFIAKTNPNINNTPTTETTPVVEKPDAPIDLLNDCVKILIGYGFTKQESLILSNKAFIKSKEHSASELVKYILQNLVELESE